MSAKPAEPVAASAVQEPPVPVPTREAEPPAAETGPKLLEDDLLVEDVSIDGMCGVY